MAEQAEGSGCIVCGRPVTEATLHLWPEWIVTHTADCAERFRTEYRAFAEYTARRFAEERGEKR